MNYTNNHEQFIHKGRTLLPAIAYGDSAGLPVETRSAAYIAENYGVIDHLIGPSKDPYLSKFEAGLWSDDTQLSIAVASGLIDSDGLDLRSQAMRHVVAYNATPYAERNGKKVKRGWGSATIAAVEKLKNGVSPEQSGTKDKAGNGVLMKMAPLSYWQAVRGDIPEERYAQYDQLTTMTHDSDVARLMTRVHGDVMHDLIHEGYEKERFIDTLYQSIGRHAVVFGLDEKEYRGLYTYLEGDVDKQAILANTDQKGFYSPQTLAMAYGALMAHEANGIPSIFEAVNLGGDTDSTASIVSAMAVFATRGIVHLPIDHKNLDQLPMIKEVSFQLADHAAGNANAS